MDRVVPVVCMGLLAPLLISAQSTDRMYRPPETARPGELAFFSGAGFQGRSYYVTGPRAKLSIPFLARSYRVAPGDRWQLCARADYRQPCVTVSASDADRGMMTGFQVRSARPVGGGGDDDDFGSGYGGPSMQGMASEFFRAPESRGRRVIACRRGSVTAACIADTADRFCRARGYAGGSAYQRAETVGRETYLADVLCSRSQA
jgi:hypothetical protein